MKHKSLNIALTCLMGGLIGTFVGLRFASIIGLIVSICTGGLTGYLLWEVKKVFAAIPVAFTETGHALRTFFRVPWRKIGTFILFLLIGVYVFLLMTISIQLVQGMSITKSVHNVGNLFADDLENMPFLSRVLLHTIGIIICSFGGMIFGALATSGKASGREVMRKFWTYYNPVVVPFFLLYWAVYALAQTIIAVARALKFTATFAGVFSKKLFLLIHSELRLLCLTDSAIGAAVGYLYHSPIIGGIIGAVFGLANYWIVTIKILKLQPK